MLKYPSFEQYLQFSFHCVMCFGLALCGCAEPRSAGDICTKYNTCSSYGPNISVTRSRFVTQELPPFRSRLGCADCTSMAASRYHLGNKLPLSCKGRTLDLYLVERVLMQQVHDSISFFWWITTTLVHHHTSGVRHQHATSRRQVS